MNGDDVRDRFLRLGDTLFPRRLSDDQAQRGVAFWGLRIDRQRCDYAPLFGDLSPIDLKAFQRKGYVDSIAGFLTNAKKAVPGISLDADLLLFSDEAAGTGGEECDAILIHELCHWYIDSGTQQTHPAPITEIDRINGSALHATLAEEERYTRHTTEYCWLSAAICRKGHELGHFASPEDGLRLAMRFERRAIPDRLWAAAGA